MRLKYLLPLATTVMCFGGVLARWMDGDDVSFFLTYVVTAIIGSIAFIVGASIDYEIYYRD